MITEPTPKRRVAFTLTELLLVIAGMAILAALLYPSFINAKQKSQRIRCTSYMKQINYSFRIWASEHTNLNPPQVSREFGGTMEQVSLGETFRHFEVMSNELNSPFILVCPSDAARTPLRDFTSPLRNSNVSYFVGIDADDLHQGAFLAGDRNILGGKRIGTNLLELTSTNGAGWDRDLHNGQGNVAMADGSVQGIFQCDVARSLDEHWAGDQPSRATVMRQP